MSRHQEWRVDSCFFDNSQQAAFEEGLSEQASSYSAPGSEIGEGP